MKYDEPVIGIKQKKIAKEIVLEGKVKIGTIGKQVGEVYLNYTHLGEYLKGIFADLDGAKVRITIERDETIVLE